MVFLWVWGRCKAAEEGGGWPLWVTLCVLPELWPCRLRCYVLARRAGQLSLWWQLKETGTGATRDRRQIRGPNQPSGMYPSGSLTRVIQGEFHSGMICKGVGGRLANQEGSRGGGELGLKE